MKLTISQLTRIIKESIGPLPGSGQDNKSNTKALNMSLANKFDEKNLNPDDLDDRMRSEIFKSIEQSIGAPIKSTVFKDEDDWKKIDGIVYAEPKLPELEKEWEETQEWDETMGKLKNPERYPGFAWRFATMMTLRRLELEDRLDIASNNLDEFMLDKLQS